VIHYLKNNLQSFTEVKNRILEDKQAGRPPSDAFMKMFKSYIGKTKEKEQLTGDLLGIQESVENAKKALQDLDSQVLHAQIINEGFAWAGRNEIRFVFPDREEAFFKAQSGPGQVLYLKKDPEEGYVIGMTTLEDLEAKEEAAALVGNDGAESGETDVSAAGTDDEPQESTEEENPA